MSKQGKAVKKTAAKAITSATAKQAEKLTSGPGTTVEQYVSTLEGWQKECISRLRQLIREAAPKANESIKWGRPVYEHKGPVAWIMGNNDLQEINAGRMDRENQGLTVAGRICGMISSGIMIFYLLCCAGYVLFIIFVGVMGAAAGK